MRIFSRIVKAALAMTAAALMFQASQAHAAAPSKPAAPAAKPAPRVIPLTVTEHGYEPSPVKLKKGEPVKLVLTRKTEQTCATEIVMKEHGIHTPLPLNTPVEVTFTPEKTGTLKYGCAMGMMISGVFLVE